MPPGKRIDLQFNSRNQFIGKEGRKLASFLGIVTRAPELTPLYIDDWRSFGKDEKKKLVEFVRKKFSIPTRGERGEHKQIEITGPSKICLTLEDPKVLPP